MLTDTMNAAFDGLFQQVNKGVAVEVAGIPKFSGGPAGLGTGTASASRPRWSTRSAASRACGPRTGRSAGYAQLVDTDGKADQPGGAPTLGDQLEPRPRRTR